MLTSPPSGPSASSAAANARATSASVPTSAWIATATPPDPLISPATRAAFSGREWYSSATGVPPAAARTAIRAPMPRPPPVTMRARGLVACSVTEVTVPPSL